jgi:hypothetical protein
VTVTIDHHAEDLPAPRPPQLHQQVPRGKFEPSYTAALRLPSSVSFLLLCWSWRRENKSCWRELIAFFQYGALLSSFPLATCDTRDSLRRRSFTDYHHADSYVCPNHTKKYHQQRPLNVERQSQNLLIAQKTAQLRLVGSFVKEVTVLHDRCVPCIKLPSRRIFSLQQKQQKAERPKPITRLTTTFNLHCQIGKGIFFLSQIYFSGRWCQLTQEPGLFQFRRTGDGLTCAISAVVIQNSLLKHFYWRSCAWLDQEHWDISVEHFCFFPLCHHFGVIWIYSRLCTLLFCAIC